MLYIVLITTPQLHLSLLYIYYYIFIYYYYIIDHFSFIHKALRGYKNCHKLVPNCPKIIFFVAKNRKHLILLVFLRLQIIFYSNSLNFIIFTIKKSC